MQRIVLVNSQKAILEIYTGSTITEELMKKLNIDKCSIIKGKKDYTEIKNSFGECVFKYKSRINEIELIYKNEDGI